MYSRSDYLLLRLGERINIAYSNTRILATSREIAKGDYRTIGSDFARANARAYLDLNSKTGFTFLATYIAQIL